MPRGDGYFRKKGKVLYWEFMHKGKRYVIRLGRITKSEAKEIVAQIKLKILKGEWEKEREESATVKDAVELYRKWYLNRTKAGERAKQTQLARLSLIEKFFGERRISELSSEDIERYKSKRLSKGVKKNTVNRELSILRSVLNRAKELGLYGGELPKIEFFKENDERLRYISPEEARKLIDACPEWFKPVVIFALNTGLRAGEIFSLRWDSIDFDNRVIRIENDRTKTKEVYTLPMNDTVYSLLKEVKQKQEEKGINHGFVFTNRLGLPYKYEDKTYRKVFKTACRKAGIEDFRFHDLRHTFASWVAMSSKDIYAVQKLLNHKDIKMTRRYAHLTEEYLKEVVNTLSDFASSSEKED